MELLKCPICDQKKLIPSQTKDVSKRAIVCENESFIHFKLGVTHFLAKTEESVKAEMEMVLN
jgi:hypothetical protein